MPGPSTALTTSSGSGTTQLSGGGASRVARATPWIFAIGDSKTAGDAWLDMLQRTPTPPAWQILDGGVPGGTVATTLANVPTLLALTGTDETPTILINLGANDSFAVPAEATWTANYLAIVDALIGRWPTARIYLARAWVRTQAAACDTLATWIAAIVAARPAHLVLGFDERIWMQGSDDGTTMTLDGIHYSAAGEVACAQQWAAVLWP